MSSQPGRRFPEIGQDLLLVGILLLVALAVRLPYLQLIPVVSDEAFEVLAALSIHEGNLVLFGPVNPTTGPLYAYLLAALFWLFGPGLYLPRILVMLIGVLTVAVVYALGRSMGGRRAGFVAGALLAFSPIHTIVNSHVAWSNAITPFFAALTFAVLHSAVRRKRGWLLVLGGLLYGISLQTHVGLLVAAPGLILWFLARRDIVDWLRRPWPYLAAGAALLGYGNMIAYNIISGGGSLADVQQHTYAWVSDPSLSIYWANVENMVHAVGLTLAGQLPRIHDPLGGLMGGLLLAWLLGSLLYTLWKGETMPLIVVLVTALIMPYFNKRYDGLLSQRYTAFLLPLCFAAMGTALAMITDSWHQQERRYARAASAGALVLALLLAAYPVRNTFAHYALERSAGRDNEAAIAIVDALTASATPESVVYLSFDLAGEKASGGRRFRRSLAYYLTLEGVENHIYQAEEITALLAQDPTGDVWLVLPPADYGALSPDYALERVEGLPLGPTEGELYRYLPAGAGP